MNNDTLLYRVINPDRLIQAGKVSSQAFRPRKTDNKRLSVYDGDQITPGAAWQHYTNDLESLPVGVLAVTVADCSSQSLRVVHDPIPFPEHTLIDFSPFGTNQIKRKSEYLRDAAESRGWQYRP